MIRRPKNLPRGNASPTILPALSGDPEWSPSFGLDRQIDDAKQHISPQRWAELEREWD